MIDAVIDRIQTLDPDREFRALAAHVTVTSPIALELLAYDNLTSPAHEARRMAAVQLRVVSEFASKLRWLEAVCMDPGVELGVRVGLTSVLRSLTDDTDLLPVLDSEAAVLLEPALLFHVLMSNLRPWMPPLILALEPDSVLELLALGIPDYLHPLLHRRFEAIWDQFHQLIQVPNAQLAELGEAPRLDGARLRRMLDAPRFGVCPSPPPPSWHTPSWVSPWLDGVPASNDAPAVDPAEYASELTG